MGAIETDTFLLFGMLLAFGAGVLSFVSPCVLPIFPAFLSYITGISVKELKEAQTKQVRKAILSHSIFFLIGVSLVFIGLGISAAYLGNFISDLLTGNSGLLIQRIAGVFIIVMGLFILGVINIPFLMQEHRMQVKKSKVSYLGTFFVGVGFAAGWTPCIGPIFGSILLLAASNPGNGIIYTFMYVIGFALPFIVLSFFIGSSQWIMKRSGIIMKIGGVIMILMGIVLLLGFMPRISEFLLDLVDDTWMSKLG
ncbi:MAG TPA: cytochrome c biogenesis protein CcdA [Pseudogracilibacillus sp.]|nr:cytochrome c biogenesis protein CcdA [Pseudogracilibacillus sp.]